MRLNAIQTLIILLAITVGTVITRFLPPILFPHGKPLPKFLHLFLYIFNYILSFCIKSLISLLNSSSPIRPASACLTAFSSSLPSSI